MVKYHVSVINTRTVHQLLITHISIKSSVYTEKIKNVIFYLLIITVFTFFLDGAT